MSYYPNNLYQTYPYNNNINYQPQMQQSQMGFLQGKIVDSLDMVKANEVPFGGFGIFPKGDLSEIYVKSWNNNGTTQINTYRAVPKEEIKEESNVNINSDLLEKITLLNEKIDLLMNSTAKGNIPPIQEQSVEKEVNKINAY